MFSIFPWYIAAVLLVALPISVAGQERIGPPPVEVLVLGTYHFANPGLDVVKTTVADVLSPGKQAEVAAVVQALARFRPTKIAVEQPPRVAATLDTLYSAYRVGQHTLSRSETQQLGFRLAARFEHPRVYPIDHKGEFPFGAMLAYAQAHDPPFARYVQEKLAEITAEENRRQREMSIGQNLRLKNEPERIRRDHGLYTQLARVGAGDTFVGADLLSSWYDRNIRIFANLQRIAEPGDRILVIFGSSHSAILRELVEAVPGMVLVEATEYLPPS